MTTYAPGGKAHMMLARLEEGAARKVELLRLGWPHESRTRLRRRFPMLVALCADGLMAYDGAAYLLTDRGREALGRLRTGEPVTSHIFARAA
jgi:hypothetical protein